MEKGDAVSEGAVVTAELQKVDEVVEETATLRSPPAEAPLSQANAADTNAPVEEATVDDVARRSR